MTKRPAAIRPLLLAQLAAVTGGAKGDLVIQGGSGNDKIEVDKTIKIH